MLNPVKTIAWYPRVWWRHLITSGRQDLPEQAALAKVPYFSQFESPALIEQFFDGSLEVSADPAWAASGAATTKEYADWAWHMCGMACFKMALAHATNTVWPTVQLAKRCQHFGGYVYENGQVDAKGLRYQPFVRFMAVEFGWQGRVMSPLLLADIQGAIAAHHYVIASVHPLIYQPVTRPPYKGGHLVLVTAYNRANQTLTYQDPWGRQGRQANVVISEQDFSRFFAQRGVIFHPTAPALSETE